MFLGILGARYHLGSPGTAQGQGSAGSVHSMMRLHKGLYLAEKAAPHLAQALSCSSCF
jgi:hypothetical protein